MKYTENLKCIQELNNQFKYYKTIESLFELDQWSALPAEGGAYRQQVAAHIAKQKAGLFMSYDAKAAYEYFGGIKLSEVEDYVERGLIRTFLSRYKNATHTPADLMREYSLLRAETMNKWKEAREKKDFQVFRPWLERVFELKKQIALSINPDKPAMDTLVGITDEGANCKEISAQFEVLKEGLIKLIDRINKSPVKPDNSLLFVQEDPKKIQAFAHRMARESGYIESRGGFNDRVVHGFTSFLGPRDARISTQQDGSLNLIFTCLHEAGHAMYSSGGNDRVNQANMWGGIEGAFQEAMARFNENMIGRNRAYWSYYFPQLQTEFESFRKVDFDEFYMSMNTVKPSLRRIQADEVTYSLHAILRYELERDYFAGKLEVRDINDAWNELMEKYLGIRPSNDTEGSLQDMHWAGDYIGYFQSYALGNIYSGQLLDALSKDITDIDSKLSCGNLSEINKWLDTNVRQYGCCYTAGELAEKITGKTLDAKPFLAYLEKKYTDLYKL